MFSPPTLPNFWTLARRFAGMDCKLRSDLSLSFVLIFCALCLGQQSLRNKGVTEPALFLRVFVGEKGSSNLHSSILWYRGGGGKRGQRGLRPTGDREDRDEKEELLLHLHFLLVSHTFHTFKLHRLDSHSLHTTFTP